MRADLAVRVQLILLVLSLGGLLGAPCDGGKRQTWVALEPDAGTVGPFSPLVVDIVVSSPTPIQAFDLGLRWNPEMLSPIGIFPHPEFDDDGAFFGQPSWKLLAGRVDGIVDLRHGGEGADGNFRVATLWFVSKGATGSTSIEPVSHGMADGSGDQPTVSVVPLSITIEP